MTDHGERETPTGAHPAFVHARPGSWFRVAAVEAPWGPIHIATVADAVVGLAVLAPREAFTADVARRTGRDLDRSSRGGVHDRAVAAVEAFLGGRSEPIAQLPVDLVDHGAWDEAVLGAVRGVGWGEVTSYGRLAAAIGRKGAARAVGGAVGRNPVGLVVPCHRVIAGDGTIGGYGGDWFGTRDELLAIKRELLALEGIRLPIAFPRGDTNGRAIGP